MFFQQIINGLSLGSAYAVIAIGYTLVFGVLNIINMAHGEIFMFGAFIGLILVTQAGTNIFVALIGAMIGGAVLGFLLEYLALRPLRRRKVTHLAPLISTIGVSIFLESLALQIWGPQTQSFPPQFDSATFDVGLFQVSLIQIIGFGTSVLLMVLLTLLLEKTKVGILGIAEVFSVAYGDYSYRDAVAFVSIILFLFFRPEGLFSSAGKGGRP